MGNGDRSTVANLVVFTDGRYKLKTLAPGAILRARTAIVSVLMLGLDSNLLGLDLIAH